MVQKTPSYPRKTAMSLRMWNMVATLLLSHGTRMILARDDFAPTQQSNNNAYCHDTEISWVD